ncbi:molecular chaperone DjiA [Nonlabens sp. Ci31]|jgi:DnaJ like chaperone protein|uniref:molecular chaperone DjiA n=1 Tax=Nonlabens sp. Ci31 TaxID=2608253 RepID=UPI0014632DF8|nr:molecular chaperone DjiA [Nonlabens sp. Ci31]QJP33857.1 molecular chaperone DjiA [Nonlabens sp. Ci31]
MSFFGYIAIFFVLRWIYTAFLSNGSSQQSRTQSGSPFQRRSTTVSPQDFELNLLSLTSLVIKADGKITQNELDYVRQYFVSSYGKERANAIFKVFNDVVKKREVDAARICSYLNARTRYESRLQILHFLFGIAQADGHISEAEIRVIYQIAGYLRLTERDFISIKAMFVKDQDNAYKILEIDKSVPDHEVKKAYRTMAKKYHPDKLMDMDEAYKKGAEEKFKKVLDAYETVRKERGMS